MKLKVRRSQKDGMMGGITFMLDVVADLTEEEAALTKRYKLYGTIVYSSEAASQNAARAQAGSVGALGAMVMDKVAKRTFTVANLIDGQHIECKELGEMLAVEDEVLTACHNLRHFLDAAKTFDGSEHVINISADGDG